MVDKLTAFRINETYSKLVGPEYLIRELQDKFTFYVKNYQHMPKVRNKLWDGKVRLLTDAGRIYNGLLIDVEKYCKENDVYFETTNKPDFQISMAEVIDFVMSLKSHVPHEHQLRAIAKVLRKRRVLLLSPTSSGKSFIAYVIHRFLARQKKKGLLIVPTINLLTQMKKDFEDYSTQNGYDVDNNVHMVSSGIDPNSSKSLIITTWQSMLKMPEKWFNQFDYVIGDEAHSFKANEIKKIMENATNADYRIGMTGTTDDMEMHELVLQGLFGEKVSYIKTHEMIEQGLASQLLIRTIVLDWGQQYHKNTELKKLTFQGEQSLISKNLKRNKFIINLTGSLNGNVLVLFKYIEHGKDLYRVIKKKFPNRKVFFIAGEISGSEREDIRQQVMNETDAIIVASEGTYATGVNIPNLKFLILALAGKAKIKLLQGIGRILRKSEGKDISEVFDIGDDFSYHNKKGEVQRLNLALQHAIEREKIYRKEKFNVKQYRVNL